MSARVLLPAAGAVLVVNMMMYALTVFWTMVPHIVARGSGGEIGSWGLFWVLALTALGVVMAVLLLAEINFAVLRQRRPRATLRPKFPRL